MLGGTTLTRVGWYEYVRQTAGDDSLEKIGAAVGVSFSTVSLWQKRAPAAKDVIAFARHYGRPVPEALMEAFGLSAEELGVEVVDDPTRLSNDQLIEELRRRLGSAGRSRKMVERQREVKRQRQSRDQSQNVSRNLRNP